MRINKKLNLVVELEDGAGNPYFVHAVPFSREAFEVNYLLFSQAFSKMIESGIQVTAGPRVAGMVLKDLATTQGNKEAYDAIIAEIKRTSTVIKGGTDGFVGKNMSSAVAHGDIDEDDLAYIESTICFFILTSAMWRGEKLAASLAFMRGLWGVQTTFLSCTDYISSLRTSTTDESSGETVAE